MAAGLCSDRSAACSVGEESEGIPPAVHRQLAGQRAPLVSEAYGLGYPQADARLAALSREVRRAGGASARLTRRGGAGRLGTLAPELGLWVTALLKARPDGTSSPLSPNSSVLRSHRCCSFPAKHLR